MRTENNAWNRKVSTKFGVNQAEVPLRSSRTSYEVTPVSGWGGRGFGGGGAKFRFSPRRESSLKHGRVCRVDIVLWGGGGGGCKSRELHSL